MSTRGRKSSASVVAREKISGKGKAPAKKQSGAPPKVPRRSASREAETDELDLRSSCYDESESDEQIDIEAATTSRPRPMGSMPIIPRTEHVDGKLRKKIRQGEFVDFKLLIPHPRGLQPRKKFAINDGLFEELEDDSNLMLYQWIDAFVVYMSVTMEFFPTEAQGMLRHIQIVKKMHAAGKDAVEYDYQFRRLKSANADICWGEYLAELAFEITEARQPKKHTGTPSGSSFHASGRYNSGRTNRQAAKGFRLCYLFNSQGGCKWGGSCRFPHICRKCSSADHPDFRCARK